jgi:NitT/TauT family transport system substrate-binding protein
MIAFNLWEIPMLRSLRFGLVTAAALTALITGAQATDVLKFQLSWRPQAEHGCYYQGVGAGIYAKHGIDLTVQPGGPQIQTQQILMSGKVEFAMGSNSFNAFNYVKQGIPMVVVGTVFQKNPQSIITHKGVGLDTIESLKGKPVYVSSIARSTWWNFMRMKYGFAEDQMRPYTFSFAPFLADKMVGQQGFVTNEPFQLQQRGVDVNVFLLADYGYDDYAYTIETSKAMVDQKPELVQRFVNATIESCYSYLFGDPTPGNKLILEANPEMTPEIIANSIAMMKARGMVAGGDAATLGIGAMTDARWKSFFDMTVEAGINAPDLNYKTGYTLQFINKGFGKPMN